MSTPVYKYFGGEKMTGNFVLGGDAYWGDNCLHVTEDGHAVSTSPFNPADDGSYTISIAFKYIHASTARRPLIGQSLNYDLLDNTNERFLIYTYNRAVYASIKENGTVGSAHVTTVNGGSLVDGENYVVDLVVSPSSVTLYINGLLVTSKTYTYTAFTSTYMVGLSCYTSNSGVYSVGSGTFDVYAFNLYDRTLTPEEVETNFKAYNERFSLGI